MKRIAMLLLCCLLMPSQSLLAESFKVGNTSINYTVPAGYLPAMDGSYAQFLKLVRDSMKNAVNVFAMYVTAEMDGEFRRNPEQGLHSYLIVLSGKDVETRLVDVEGFKMFRDSLRGQQEEIDPAAITRKLDEVFDNESATAAGVILPVGVFAESDTGIYSMAVAVRSFDVEGARIMLRQAMVSGYFLVQGKMIGVNQYRMVPNSLEAERFMAEAVKVVESMHFAYGGAEPGRATPPAAEPEQAQKPGGLDPGMMRALGMAAGGAIIGAIIIFLRRKK